MSKCGTLDCPTAICIPVRDEERRLPALMARLMSFQNQLPNLVVALTFDGCEDAGWDLVQPFLTASRIRAQLIERSDTPNAGRARVAAMAYGCDLLSREFASKNRDDFLLLSTDADTIPHDDWVASARVNLAEVDVVAGLTRLDETEHCPYRVKLEAYLERLHALRRLLDPIGYDPSPSHPFVGAANLGVRLSTYEALEGLRPLATGEDGEFVKRARMSGYKVRQARDMQVTTSSRLTGRAQGGLAKALVQTETKPIVVEHPLDAIAHYRFQAQLRALYAAPAPNAETIRIFASRLSTPVCKVDTELANAPSADAFVTRISEGRCEARTVPLEAAITILDDFEAKSRKAA